MAREPKESVRGKILSAAKERFWRFGIKKTTIDEIAADADVGKGSVYLHFESKEEIALAILLEYKHEIFVEQEAVAADTSRIVVERIKDVLRLPVLKAQEHCIMSPMVMEMIHAIKPQFSTRFKEITEKENQLIAKMITEANATGEMHVEEPYESARIIKLLSMVFMPSSPSFALVRDSREEIGRMVDLIYKGLK